MLRVGGISHMLFLVHEWRVFPCASSWCIECPLAILAMPPRDEWWVQMNLWEGVVRDSCQRCPQQGRFGDGVQQPPQRTIISPPLANTSGAHCHAPLGYVFFHRIPVEQIWIILALEVFAKGPTLTLQGGGNVGGNIKEYSWNNVSPTKHCFGSK